MPRSALAHSAERNAVAFAPFGYLDEAAICTHDVCQLTNGNVQLLKHHRNIAGCQHPPLVQEPTGKMQYQATQPAASAAT